MYDDTPSDRCRGCGYRIYPHERGWCGHCDEDDPTLRQLVERAQADEAERPDGLGDWGSDLGVTN